MVFLKKDDIPLYRSEPSTQVILNANNFSFEHFHTIWYDSFLCICHALQHIKS